MKSFGTPFQNVATKTVIDKDKPLNVGEKIIMEYSKTELYSPYTTEQDIVNSLVKDIEEDYDFKVEYAFCSITRKLYEPHKADLVIQVHATVMNASPVAPIIIIGVVALILGITALLCATYMTIYLVETAKEVVEDIQEGLDKIFEPIFGEDGGIGQLASGGIMIGIILIILIGGIFLTYIVVK